MTKREFKRKATIAFMKVNPTATIEWITATEIIYPTGIKEWSGRFSAIADGYRAKTMIVSGADDYIMVR
jgi:hypothetical protein